MSKNRFVKLTLNHQPVTDGAGVRLNRLPGRAEAPALDPVFCRMISGQA